MGKAAGTPRKSSMPNVPNPKIQIKKGKLFYILSMETDPVNNLVTQNYLKNSMLVITFSKDSKGRDIIANGSCTPFRSLEFCRDPNASPKKLKSQATSNQGSLMNLNTLVGSPNPNPEVLVVADTPMFCFYNRLGGCFIATARAGLIRDDDQIIELRQNQHKLFKLTEMIYAPISKYPTKTD